MSEQHERFEGLVTKCVEGAASAAERAELESHMASCTECRAAFEAERRVKEAMIHETKAFTEGYDAGRLEVNLANGIRSAASSTRWLAALAALFGLLTIVLYVRPFASEPGAWLLTLPPAIAFLVSLHWPMRYQARLVAIARAAEGARGGYRDLERARVQVNVRGYRMRGRLGLAAAFAIGLWDLIKWIELRHALPAAEVKGNVSGSFVNAVIIFACLFTLGLGSLWKARRLEKTITAKTKADAESL